MEDRNTDNVSFLLYTNSNGERPLLLAVDPNEVTEDDTVVQTRTCGGVEYSLTGFGEKLWAVCEPVRLTVWSLNGSEPENRYTTTVIEVFDCEVMAQGFCLGLDYTDVQYCMIPVVRSKGVYV